MGAILKSIFKTDRLVIRTLRTKFVLMTMVFVVAIMSVFGLLTVQRETKIIRQEIIRQGEILVENIGISVTNTLLYEELGLVEEAGLLDNYISEIMSTDKLQVIYAMVLGTDKKVEAHSNLMEYGKIYQDRITNQAAQSNTTIAMFYTHPETGKQVLDISTPLSISTKKWGTLRIGLSLETLETQVVTITRRIIYITLTFMGIFLTAAFWMSNRLVRPIKLLSQNMDDISPGDYEVKNPSHREDEIGTLERSFTLMLNRLKIAEEEAEKSREMMVQTEKMASVGLLASGVAHEINNPLGGVLNLINQLIKSEPPFEKRQEYLSLAKDGLKRIERIIKQLLDFSQERPPELTPVDMNVIVEAVVSIFQHSLGEKQGITVEKELKFSGDNLYVDRYQIEQVLMNLLLNSASFMEDGGRIRVTANNCPDCCCVKVEDNGIGIPEEMKSKIFDPFFTTKEVGKGTGLGLPVSLAIVKQHGGTIEVDSEPGKGSIFTVKLPYNKTKIDHKITV